MKVLPFLVACTAVAVVSIAVSFSSNSSSSLCDYQPVTEFNPKLPASHIQNQCARYQDGVAEVSWLSWLAGQSPSFQFHFLDLLELLHKDESRAEFTTSNDA
ncbi:hypothetical protein D210916BOD24_01050 [Alteromonas sp. D210916BOD_24]|uniref:hypothetical protein n=1 Tax=Alteromonas sp. D210916BOD_24 TaxID=3157618 RepID=UPI00399C7C10